MHEPAIRDIPLCRLALAPENVRKTPPDPQADAEIKASIAAHGLLENLVVRPEDNHGAYAVVAGRRRLAALKALAEDGAIGADQPVPCLIATNGNAGELSLAENVVRIAMHPADQVVAFAGLAASGATVAAIAARFGVSERTVEQRLRLGNAAPELLEAYRASEIDLQTLMAFAVTTDHGRQRAVWKQVSGQGYRPAAWQVKRMLTEERVPAGTAIARFVGVEAYEAAGGPVLRDLFADEHENGVWLEDPVLLEKLAADKLQAAADELSTRWKWAEAVPEVDWNATARYGRIHPEPGEPTDAEKAEIEKLRTRHDELADLDEEDWTDELAAEAEAVEARLDEIEAGAASRARFKREDFAIAGCIATVGHDGSLQVIQGLVRPEDMPKPAQESADQSTGGGEAAAHPDGSASAGTERIAGPALSPSVQSPRDREAEARKEAGVGIGLADDLRSVRTALVKAHLAGDFEAAFDLMLFQMGRAVFTPGYHDHALDIAVRETADRPKMRMNEAEFADSSPGEAMLEDRSHLSFDWLEIMDRAESFAALRALPRAGKQALFAACVARTVNGQLAFEHGARPELEATVARLDVDFAKHIRPTADMYWSRIAKGRILETARAVCGPAWASSRSKYKKPALANTMEDAFATGDPPLGLGADAHAAALAWTLPGFAAFDTGSVDGDDADTDASDIPAAETSGAVAGPAADPEADTAAGAGTPAAAPDVAERPAPDAANVANGDGRTGPPPNGDGEGTADAQTDATQSAPADTAPSGDTARTEGTQAPVPVNGHGGAPDPMEIPEFLRRVPGCSPVH